MSLAAVAGFTGASGVIASARLSTQADRVTARLARLEAGALVVSGTAAYGAAQGGAVGLAALGLLLMALQYLVAELLTHKRRGQELERMAGIDELTGLANRETFNARLVSEVESAAASGEAFAVVLIDLDRFREINDTLGHHYGDVLLGQLGPRLTECVGPDGLVARLGGDEFALLPASHSIAVSDLEALAAGVQDAVQLPVVVDELTLEVSASIGIARFPFDGDDANALLRRADVAMYAAKEANAGWRIYASELDRHSVRRLSVLGDFRRALAAGEIVVHFQPIFDVVHSQVRGAECLVRWEHPQLGLLPPGAFIHTVEQTGLIGPMTRYVLERAIAECADWRRAGRDLTVAVNLSVRNLLDRSLPAEVHGLLALYGLPPAALRLEITESMLMSDPERAMTVVQRLSDLGVRLSVDDFGTGYSSLANLRRLPIDELKIDRSFISPMLRDESDLIIVRSTINLGHDLGLQVIAEGVEDAQTLEHLVRLGCDLVQGYHLSRPLAPDQFRIWIDAAADRLAVRPALRIVG